MKAFWLVMALCASTLLAEENGKVFVKSEPAGADIYLVVKDGDKIEQKPTNKKTSALINLKDGPQKLVLILKDYKPYIMEIDVPATGILKPDTVVLEKFVLNTDLIFEEGWSVAINKQPAKDIAGKPAVTPCTISLPLGQLEFTLSKEGFEDIKEKMNIQQSTSLTFTSKPKKAAPKKEQPKEQKVAQPLPIGLTKEDIVGSWNIYEDGRKLNVHTFMEDGTGKSQSGKTFDWKLKGNEITSDWVKWKYNEKTKTMTSTWSNTGTQLEAKKSN